MYSTKPGLIIGFHGCDQSICDIVVSGQSTLKASRNNYDWLGHGIYFWENNYERAFEFASSPPRNRKISHPAVIGAVIDLQHCLDLLDNKYLTYVRDSYIEFNSFFFHSGLKIPVNKNAIGSRDLLIRELDCAVIEYLHQSRKDANLTPFDSVRGVFVEGSPLYPGAGFNDKNHIQICIRNPNCIKGLFIPRKELTLEEVFKLISPQPEKPA